MQGLPDSDLDFSFKDLFVPFTTAKAITWIIIIGFIVYGNMLFNGFVWDDKTYIVNNIDIRTLNFFQLFGPNSYNSFGFYRPLAAIYFALLYAFFGENS